MTDSARILARQLSTNAVTTFADRERKRTRQTFQDAWIADQIERLLLEISPLQGDVDHAQDAACLAGEDSIRSKAVEAVTAALRAVDAPRAVSQPTEPDPSTDSNAGQQGDLPQFMKGDPEKSGEHRVTAVDELPRNEAERAAAEVDRLLGKAA